jgi:NitT/TauT family transport system permease protein
VNQLSLRRIWGQATAVLDRTRKVGWVDLLVLVGLAGLLFGVIDLAHHATGVREQQVEINLDDPWALLRYTFFSLMRGLIAYALSLGFTLVYGYWAAKDRVAERVLVPLLDILQSIPVLGFMPGLILAFMALFPNSNVGLELAAIIMIFTGQAWNMTFSYYHSLKSVPLDQREVATVYRFSWWQRLKWVELPFATMGLVWNSMMSMAGGWFFLMMSESFDLGEGKDFRLPGLGSYMTVAVSQERFDAMAWAVLAMVVMIVALDQLLWNPVVVWAQKFRVEEGGAQEEKSSWFLNWLRRSRLLTALGGLRERLQRDQESRPAKPKPYAAAANPSWAAGLSLVIFLALLAALAYGAWRLVGLLAEVPWPKWGELFLAALVTLGRVLLSTALGTLWALPAGLAIGLSPRLSRLLQPVVQIVASFPAPMLFPLAVLVLHMAGVPLNWGSIVLMLLGTQWYILFNVIAGAMAIPADLREAARSYRISGWQRFWVLYFPAVFPYLVTGWVTAAGGAWNASIVSEYVAYTGPGAPPDGVLTAWGLGAEITKATKEAANSSEAAGLLAASVLVMALLVVVFNRTVWRRCYQLAETRFSLQK